MFGKKSEEKELEKLRRQVEILSKKVKRFEQNVRTGIFSVGIDADLEAEATRLDIQPKDISTFVTICKKVIGSYEPATFTFHDTEGHRFDCEIKKEADRINVIKRDNTLLEASMGNRLLDKVVAGGKSLDQVKKILRPTSQNITLLMTDLRSFTPFAEKASPDEVSALLLDFYDIVYPSIYENDGVVDKAMGDGVLAIFGAPFTMEGHQAKAVQAGHSILDKWKNRISGKNLPVAGVAIDTGQCIVGNLGYKNRIDFTVVGDMVNTVARLSSDVPGQTLWAGKNTVEGCGKELIWKKLPPKNLKGRSQPVEILELETVG